MLDARGDRGGFEFLVRCRVLRVQYRDHDHGLVLFNGLHDRPAASHLRVTESTLDDHDYFIQIFEFGRSRFLTLGHAHDASDELVLVQRLDHDLICPGPKRLFFVLGLGVPGRDQDGHGRGVVPRPADD